MKLKLLLSFICLVISSCFGWDFYKTNELNSDHWTASSPVELSAHAKTRIECASLCQNAGEQICNAFEFVVSSMTCQGGKITELEEANPAFTYKEVYVYDGATLSYKCQGGESCCSPQNLCGLNDGDCETNSDCFGSLICGDNNCIGLGKSGGLWDNDDDCCVPPCSTQSPCNQGQGPCSQNAECADNQRFECKVGICTDTAYFPAKSYPDNTAANFDASMGCCTRKCHSFQQCGNDAYGCEFDTDCESGLSCLLLSGQCKDIDECAAGICVSNADCTNSVGSFDCQCHEGYENWIAGTGCTDIDECSAVPSPCGIRATCENTPGSYTCTCPDGYEGDAAVECFDIDECEVGGQYACTFGPQTELADMACLNWPGTFQCVDAAIMSGGSTGEFNIINSLNKDYYKETVVRCGDGGLPTMSPVKWKHEMVYVNDYLFICGGYDQPAGTSGLLATSTCTKLNLNTKQYESMPSMNKARVFFNLVHVEGKIYALGGHTGDDSVNDPDSNKPCMNSVEYYDLGTNVWTPFAAGNLPSVNHRSCAVQVGYEIYLLGGHTGTDASKHVMRFNTRSPDWDYNTKGMKDKVYDHGCSVLYLENGGKRLYVVGGKDRLDQERKEVMFMGLGGNDDNWYYTGPELPTKWNRMPRLAYLGKSLVIWSGRTNSDGDSKFNIAVMDWSTKEWIQDGRWRSGDDETWSAATVISSKYFESHVTACTATQWFDCAKKIKITNGNLIGGSPLTVATSSGCADKCMETKTPVQCESWTYEGATDECKLRDNPNAQVITGSDGFNGGKRRECFSKWQDDVTVPQP